MLPLGHVDVERARGATLGDDLATRSASARLMSQTATFAPSMANLMAVASPMPEAEPVMIATLSLKRMDDCLFGSEANLFNLPGFCASHKRAEIHQDLENQRFGPTRPVRPVPNAATRAAVLRGHRTGPARPEHRPDTERQRGRRPEQDRRDALVAAFEQKPRVGVADDRVATTSNSSSKDGAGSPGPRPDRAGAPPARTWLVARERAVGFDDPRKIGGAQPFTRDSLECGGKARQVGFANRNPRGERMAAEARDQSGFALGHDIQRVAQMKTAIERPEPLSSPLLPRAKTIAGR